MKESLSSVIPAKAGIHTMRVIMTIPALIIVSLHSTRILQKNEGVIFHKKAYELLKKTAFYERIHGYIFLPSAASFMLFFWKRLAKWQKILFSSLIFGGLALGAFGLIQSTDLNAGILPPNWDRPLGSVQEFFQIPAEGNAVDRIKALIWKNIVPLAKYIMIAVAMIFATILTMQLITAAGDEEQIKSAQKNLLWQFMGFLVMALAIDLAQALDPFVNNGELVNKEIFETSQYRLITYMQLIAGVVAVFYIFFAGFRLITSQADEELVTAQKNHVKWGFVGLMAIMLSDPLINRVFYPAAGQRGLGTEELRVFFQEGIGTLNFFLSFTGILATVALVISGVMYVTAMGDDGRLEKARKGMFSSAIALVIIVTSYILVSTFIPPGPVQG